MDRHTDGKLVGINLLIPFLFHLMPYRRITIDKTIYRLDAHWKEESKQNLSSGLKI